MSKLRQLRVLVALSDMSIPGAKENVYRTLDDNGWQIKHLIATYGYYVFDVTGNSSARKGPLSDCPYIESFQKIQV